MAERYINVDLHAHTTYSDAVFSPNDRILQACHDSGLHIVPVTDHETTRGVPVMRRDLDSFNEKYGLSLPMFAGIEFKTIFGYRGTVTNVDIVAGHIDENPAFLRWAERQQEGNPDTVDTIRQSIVEHNALVVIPHAGLNAANSVPIELLPYLFDKLGDSVRQNVVLETVNSADNSFPGAGERIHRRRLFASEYGINMVGNSDAHHPSERGMVYTAFDFEGDLNHDNLLIALQQQPGEIIDHGTRGTSLRTAGIMFLSAFKNATVLGNFPIDPVGILNRKRMMRECRNNGFLK